MDNNPHGLSPEELSVLHFWQNGDNMTDAYKRVMVSRYDEQNISDAALKKRVLRFFGTYRMREAMADTPGERGEKARIDFDRWRANQKAETIRQFIPSATPSFEEPFVNMRNRGKQDEDAEVISDNNEQETEEETSDEPASTFSKIVQPHIQRFNNQQNTEQKTRTDREKWLESLNINQNPTAMTIYGTGQYLAYVAVKEIMARQQAIKENNISVLHKNGSALTPTIISALKTAAAMVLPFAPAPTVEDRREMTKAAVLLGLMPENISESPDDYTAPIPTAIDINED